MQIKVKRLVATEQDEKPEWEWHILDMYDVKTITAHKGNTLFQSTEGNVMEVKLPFEYSMFIFELSNSKVLKVEDIERIMLSM